MAFQDDIKNVLVKYGKKTMLNSSLSNILKDTSSIFRDDKDLQLLVQQFVNGGFSSKLLSWTKYVRRKRDRKSIEIVTDFANYACIKKENSLSIVQYFRYALGWDKHFGDFPSNIDTSWNWSDLIDTIKHAIKNKFVIGATTVLIIICFIFIILRNNYSNEFQEKIQEYNNAQIIDNNPETVLLRITELQSKYCGIFSSSEVDYLSTSIFEKAVSSKCRKLASLHDNKAVVEWLNSYSQNGKLTAADRTVLQDYKLIYNYY